MLTKIVPYSSSVYTVFHSVIYNSVISMVSQDILIKIRERGHQDDLQRTVHSHDQATVMEIYKQKDFDLTKKSCENYFVNR